MVQPRTILVTGAGGPAGIAVILELSRLGFATLGCDINPYGAGLRLATNRELVPSYNDSEYLSVLLGLATSHRATGLISTMTEELSVLTADGCQERLAEAGIATWFPPKAAIDTCLDKRLFAEVTEAAGQPVPGSAWGDVQAALKRIPGPWIIKPSSGRGSRDIYAADTADEVRACWERVPEPILQTRLVGREFTFDVLVDRGGVLVGGVPRFRLETKAGISTVGKTFAAPGIFELTEGLLGCLGHTGPASVQGFIGVDGEFGFTEVNPRFSGALPLSLGAGADLVGQYVGSMFGEPIDPDRLSYERGTVMLRYFSEVFFTEPPPLLPPLRPIRGR